MPENQKCRKNSKAAKLAKCQKDMAKWVGDREKAKNEIQERLAQIDECDQTIEKTSGAEAELYEEIRILQAGDEKRNSCASQSNGGCFDPAVVQQFITMGATQAWQQLTCIQGELSRVHAVQHQPAPATPVHVLEGGEGGDENEEEQRRRAASRQMGQPAPEGRNEGFPSGSVFDPSKFSRNAGEGDKDKFNSPRGGGRERGRHIRREKGADQSRSFNSSKSSSLMEMGCRDVKMKRKEKIKRKRNSQGKNTKTFEGNTRERARVPHRPRIKVGRKGKSASHRRSAQRRKKRRTVEEKGIKQKRKKWNEGIRKRCRKKRRYKEMIWPKAFLSKEIEQNEDMETRKRGGCPKLDSLGGKWENGSSF